MSRLILAFLLLFAPASLAQPADRPVEQALVEETRAQKLDRLFDELADAKGETADDIADQIAGLWAQSGSDSMDLLLQRARKATKEENYAKARAHLSALTRLAPDFAEGWNASATLHFIEDEYWLAVEHIQRTLALEPRHFGALSGLAMILEHVDRDEAALSAWREVTRLFPGMERARHALDRLEKSVDGKDI